MNHGRYYIPMDWRRAIAKNEELADRLHGAVLFADISGFTALTETFARELGPKRGAEEFTIQLNQVFYAIVADLHRYGGSVVSFSGDAITCWFDGDTDGKRALACALTMQQTMERLQDITTAINQTVKLGIKLAVSAGSVRRFVVGMPEYTLMDAMAGHTLERVTAAEGMAEKGDVVLDQVTAEGLQDHLVIQTWRTHEETGQTFAVVEKLNLDVQSDPWMYLPENALADEAIQEWILPAVYGRLSTGAGEFLSELRPTVAMFIRFSGIDYDQDPDAPQKLNNFVSHVQKVLIRFGGSLLQLTIGDKGSYMYASFGAPVANEDDAERAASAAIQLIDTSDNFELDQKLQIGITQGEMWAGAYGGAERKTYGVMGNNVNLAARLMMKAEPGQILLDQNARQKVDLEFLFNDLGKVQFKGKLYKTQVYELIGRQVTSGFHLFETAYNMPMVGREDEMQEISSKIPLVQTRWGQIVGITAEAGMGKSRFAAEFIQQAESKGVNGFGGEGESFGTNSSYLIWENIWRGIFKLSPSYDTAKQIEISQNELVKANPDFIHRHPLLSQVLNINIPETDLTSSLDPKAKKTALESLLLDYLKYFSEKEGPLLILLEDAHWIDDLSLELLDLVSKSIEHLPILLLLVYRPENSLPDFSPLPNFTEIKLDLFSKEEAETLIRYKLSQHFSTYRIPQKLSQLIMEKSGGNPFYIEEILNYIKDLNLDVRDETALANLDLPDTIYSLILSRVDRLTQRQQVALRVASVIGRLFRSAMVWGVYPERIDEESIQSDLDVLSKLEITAVEHPEPELTYLFRHIVTHEVTYESLPYNTRSHLHEQVAKYMEAQYAENLDQFIDLLAFHYSRSKNNSKKKEYLLKAGEAAKENFANVAAIDYYTRSLELLDGKESIPVKINIGETQQLIGKWEEAEKIFLDLIETTKQSDYSEFYPQVLNVSGELKRKQGDYSAAEDYFRHAKRIAEELKDDAGIGKSLLYLGTLNAQQGNFDEASVLYLDSLKIQKNLGDDLNIANILNNLGVISEYLGNNHQARSWHEEALEVRQTNGFRQTEAVSLNNLANVLLELEQPEEALNYLENALTIQRQIGDRWSIANILNNFGNAARETNQLQKSIHLYKESLEIYGELGDKWALSFLLEDIGILFAIQGIAKKSMFLIGVADKLREEINSPLSEVLKEKLDSKLKPAKEKLGDLVSKQAWSAGRKTKVEDAINIALDQLSRSASLDTPNLPDFDGAVAYALDLIRSDLDPKYVYHNIVHTANDVMPAAMRLAEFEGLPENEKMLLKVAAAFHDVGYINGGAVEHEARSCVVARTELPQFGFSAKQIDMICETIMATKIPQTPTSLAGQILADADLDLLGRTDFPECSHRLRLELEELGSQLTDLQWFSQQITFLEGHNYFTDAAMATRHPQKLTNVEWLKNLVKELS